jgi:hypothetical protein
MSAITGDRPGTRTFIEDCERAETAHNDGRHGHGKLAKDPTGVFEARQKSSPDGERDFSNDPEKASQASRKMDTRGGRI